MGSCELRETGSFPLSHHTPLPYSRSMPCHPRLALLSPHRRWRASSRLSPRPQRVNLHVSFQVCGQGCGRSLYCEGESQAVEALNLPTPTCFRSRSHSYLRAIQAGCSQDEDTASVDSDSSPPTTTGCTYTSSPSECTVMLRMGGVGWALGSGRSWAGRMRGMGPGLNS